MASINDGAHERTKLSSDRPSTSYSSIEQIDRTDKYDQDSDLRPLLGEQQSRAMSCNGESAGMQGRSRISPRPALLMLIIFNLITSLTIFLFNVRRLFLMHFKFQ